MTVEDKLRRPLLSDRGGMPSLSAGPDSGIVLTVWASVCLPSLLAQFCSLPGNSVSFPLACQYFLFCLDWPNSVSTADKLKFWLIQAISEMVEKIRETAGKLQNVYHSTVKTEDGT